MPHKPKTTNPEWLPRPKEPGAFWGFESLQSNTTYTPNQFFDVCLPHYSRGVVRLVGYIIYQTFAWSDRNGRPMNEQHKVTYQELIAKAGISRGSLAEAINEAVKGNLITIKKGHADQAGKHAQSTIFELKWSDDPEYIKQPKRFKGFYEGNGNRTYIPNQFFTRIVPNEPLVITKVVGSIIRFSIGFQVKRGFRRQEIALSYRDIQHFAHIKSPHDLSKALRHAIGMNYIHCVEQGYFDPNAGKKSKATVYSLRWAQDKRADSDVNSDSYDVTGSKSVAGYRFKIRSETGSKSVAGDRFKIRSDIEIKQLNKTSKQQQDAVAQVSLEDEDMESFKRLCEAGFDIKTAQLLASIRSIEHIKQQIAWLPKRHPTQNPLGLLRKAIEEDWPEPVDHLVTEPTVKDSPETIFGRHFYAGLGRNNGTPVAMPSRTDIVSAGPFIAELLKIWPNPNHLSDWGRRFGLQIANGKGVDAYPMSLAQAIRQFGNGFVVWVRKDRERQLRCTVNQNRESYEGQFKADYLHYVAELESECLKTNPQAYREFLAYREAHKADIEKTPGEFIRGKLLQHHNTHTALIQDFIKYFPEVPDFWGWNAQFNREHQIA